MEDLSMVLSDDPEAELFIESSSYPRMHLHRSKKRNLEEKTKRSLDEQYVDLSQQGAVYGVLPEEQVRECNPIFNREISPESSLKMESQNFRRGNIQTSQKSSENELSSYEYKLEQVNVWRKAREQKYPVLKSRKNRKKKACSLTSSTEIMIKSTKSATSKKYLSDYLGRTNNDKHLLQLKKCASTVSTLHTTNCSTSNSERSIYRQPIINEETTMVPNLRIFADDFSTEIELNHVMPATEQRIKKNQSKLKEIMAFITEEPSTVEYKVPLSMNVPKLRDLNLSASSSSSKRIKWNHNQSQKVSLKEFIESGKRHANITNYDELSHCTVCLV